ncbi:Lariat debranching enzyme [Sparassis crispa]|uniref:Lariat debranching enzyme n=1 Tax=Sparassis crispa TaxID=139825 RepID=A0A401GMH5_9APHY|nr:Lariat debranching enzyme [Sparassis crispa]GBE82954.1 Lariat debranching enzyme [Sparassis crispa]
MKIAIEGCCHGELDAIYAQIGALEQRNKYKVDLLLICGDFQAVRNHRDLQCMAVPDKYRQLGGFYKYYTGEKAAPVLTIVIGGNHEASNYLWELYHGGWLAPNIYFLGHAGCVQVNGVRIAGASGIFKPQDFRQGHWERVPYNHGSMRSIYHIREFNVRKLSLLSSPTIFLSHDWPQSIEHHGNLPELLRRKPYFREDIKKGALGSPPMMGLLHTLQPEWWFAAHLHCRFEARVVHETASGASIGTSAVDKNPDEIAIEDDDDDDEKAGTTEAEAEVSPINNGDVAAAPRNSDEIVLDDEEEDIVAPPPAPLPPAETKFLALDKCLPRRQFLEIVDVPVPASFTPPSNSSGPVLAYDAEWLAITRAFHPYMSVNRSQIPFPDEAQAREAVRRELEWVRSNVLEGNREKSVDECQQFVMTAPAPGSEGAALKQQPPHYPNPQTAAFCAMLGIENRIDPPPSLSSHPSHVPTD